MIDDKKNIMIIERKAATPEQKNQKENLVSHIQAVLALTLTAGVGILSAKISPKENVVVQDEKPRIDMVYVYEIDTDNIKFFDTKQENENYKLLGLCEKQEPFSLYKQYEDGKPTGRFIFDVHEPPEYGTYTYTYMESNPYSIDEEKGKNK